MEKLEFKDFPITDTPIDADNLNLLQNNVENEIEAVVNGLIDIVGLNKGLFSESKTYAVADFVTNDYILYKCHTAVTTAGAWTGSANWSEASIIEYENEKLQIDNDLIDTIGTTYDYILTPVNSNYAVGGWRTMATNYTTGVIPAGTYLMIFKFMVNSSQSAMGLTTARAMIDGEEIVPTTRITIPTGGATMSGEIIAPVTFATSTTHTLNGNIYPLYQAITGGTNNLSYSFIRVK